MLVVWQTEEDMLCCTEVSQQTDEMGHLRLITDVQEMSFIRLVATELVSR
jgi:hypothetical protein